MLSGEPNQPPESPVTGDRFAEEQADNLPKSSVEPHRGPLLLFLGSGRPGAFLGPMRASTALYGAFIRPIQEAEPMNG